MTSADKLAWATVTPKKCRRHEWRWRENLNVVVGYASEYADEQVCARCGQPRDLQRERRGLNNRRRGNAIERDVAKQLGLRRVGHFGGPEDVGTAADPFMASVKSGNGYFSERYWAQLKRLPVKGQQTAILVVTDAPGPGHKRRAYVVLELSDWIALHGPEVADEVA
jgi:hypothetical protein